MNAYVPTLLLGAASTLAATSIVQLRVVPRAEARKRREERWELDMRSLGELVTFDLDDAALGLYRAVTLEVFTSARRPGLTVTELAELRAEQAARLHEARHTFDRVTNMVVWLIDQITTPSTASSPLAPATTRLLLAQRRLYEVADREGKQTFLSEAKEVTAGMEIALEGLRFAVRTASAGQPPTGHRSLRRVGHRVGRLLAIPIKRRSLTALEREDSELMAWARTELSESSDAACGADLTVAR